MMKFWISVIVWSVLGLLLFIFFVLVGIVVFVCFVGFDVYS